MNKAQNTGKQYLKTSDDIRDKAYINQDDILALNFIKGTGSFVFRRHFRQGLRSHVVELLKSSDVELEKSGCEIDGLRWFPKAKPYKIFRIFRTRLKTLGNALREIDHVKLVERYLFPDFLARSNEFIVDYISPEGPDLMLCGLQEYVDGEIIDPWSVLDQTSFLPALHDNLGKRVGAHTADSADRKDRWVRNARDKGGLFIEKVKKMFYETGHIPDLAGVGNLIMGGSGIIKLVDINNICKASYESTLQLDDRGYPVFDKSVEALCLLEKKLLDREIDKKEKIYKSLFDTDRKKEADRLAAIFYNRIKTEKVYLTKEDAEKK